MTCVRGQKRRRAPRERGRDSLFEPRLDLELGEGETLPFGREGASGWGYTFPLLERALERRKPVPCGARALRHVVAFGRGRARGRARSVRAALELGRGRGAAARVCSGNVELVAEAAYELGDALAASAEPFPCGAERHERPVRLSDAGRELCELPVDLLPLATDRLEPLLRLLGRRPLDRREDGVGVTCPLDRLPALGRRIARRGARVSGGLLEETERVVRRRALRPLRLLEVVTQPGRETACRLCPDCEPLTGALEAIERADRGLARASGVRQLDLGTLAVAEDGREPLLRRATGERRGAPALLRLDAALVERGEVEPGDPGPKGDDLAGQLLRALGRRRLQGKGPQPLPDLLFDVAGAFDLDGDASKLELGPMTSTLELSETGSLFDERASVLRLRREDRVDLPLGDDRVHRAAEADVREQLDEIGATHRGAVDEVLAFAAPCEPPRDRKLAEVELLTETAVLVVEHQLDLAVVGRRPRRGAAEEDVVRLLRSKLRRRQRARRPDDRIGHVRLPGAVRADDDRDAGLE